MGHLSVQVPANPPNQLLEPFPTPEAACEVQDLGLVSSYQIWPDPTLCSFHYYLIPLVSIPTHVPQISALFVHVENLNSYFGMECTS